LVKRNTTAQIRRLLQDVFNVLQGIEEDEVGEAVEEARAAVRRVLDEGVEVELAPRSAALRQIQHRVAARYHLVAESVGSEPLRHLIIHPA
jgi:predicted RNA-binding protein Jag